MIVKSLPSLMTPPIRLHRPVVRLLSSAALLWMAASCAAADPVPTGHDDEGASVFVSSVPEYVRRAPEGPDSQPIFEEVMEGLLRHRGEWRIVSLGYVGE